MTSSSFQLLFILYYFCYFHLCSVCRTVADAAMQELQLWCWQHREVARAPCVACLKLKHMLCLHTLCDIVGIYAHVYPCEHHMSMPIAWAYSLYMPIHVIELKKRLGKDATVPRRQFVNSSEVFSPIKSLLSSILQCFNSSPAGLYGTHLENVQR